MISSASSPDRAPRSEAIAAPGPIAPRPLAARQDRVSTDGAAFLRSELDRQPEIRPEVVARGLALAADKSYPSFAVISSVARQILASPDLSNDEA